MKDKNSIVQLIARDAASPPAAPTPDECTARRVFAYVSRVGEKEFYDSAAVGMLPVLRATIWEVEYAGQMFVRHNGTTYKVLRAYDDKTSGERELTCEEAVL